MSKSSFFLMLPAILLAVMPTVSTEAAAFISTFYSHNIQIASFITGGLWIMYHCLPAALQKEITADTMPKV